MLERQIQNRAAIKFEDFDTNQTEVEILKQKEKEVKQYSQPSLSSV